LPSPFDDTHHSSHLSPQFGIFERFVLARLLDSHDHHSSSIDHHPAPTPPHSQRQIDFITILR
jgi:hypothetical protein